MPFVLHKSVSKLRAAIVAFIAAQMAITGKMFFLHVGDARHSRRKARRESDAPELPLFTPNQAAAKRAEIRSSVPQVTHFAISSLSIVPKEEKFRLAANDRTNAGICK